jgi:hypothetical protein
LTVFAIKKVINKSTRVNVKGMRFKQFAVFFLTTAVLLSLSSVAMADSLVSNGSGGDHSYELWQSRDNTEYYLKVWKRQSYKDREPLWIVHNFQSSRQALDYFDCYYAGKSLPACPR